MKKRTLATLFAVTAISTALIANAETKSENFSDLTRTAQEGKIEFPSSEQVKSTNADSFINGRMEPRGESRFEPKNGKSTNDKRDERRAEKMERKHCLMQHERMSNSFHGLMMPNHDFMHPSRNGFVSAKAPTKVSDADKWQDDQFIVLEGNIVKQVGKKDFVFKDTSGELTLEINRKAWRDGLISPEDKIRIVADVEKSWGKTEVEAFSVEKVDKPQFSKPSLDGVKGELPISAPATQTAPKAE